MSCQRQLTWRTTVSYPRGWKLSQNGTEKYEKYTFWNSSHFSYFQGRVLENWQNTVKVDCKQENRAENLKEVWETSWSSYGFGYVQHLVGNK